MILAEIQRLILADKLPAVWEEEKVDHFIFSNFDTGYIILDENDAHQIVYFANGNWYTSYISCDSEVLVDQDDLIDKAETKVYFAVTREPGFLFVYFCLLIVMHDYCFF